MKILKMRSEKINTKCEHNNTSWSALHDCHFCNDCRKWVDYDYTLKQYRVYNNGKWVIDNSCNSEYDCTDDGNVGIGLHYLCKDIIVKTCKHGADWHHPDCDDPSWQ